MIFTRVFAMAVSRYAIAGGGAEAGEGQESEWEDSGQLELHCDGSLGSQTILRFLGVVSGVR